MLGYANSNDATFIAACLASQSEGQIPAPTPKKKLQ